MLIMSNIEQRIIENEIERSLENDFSIEKALDALDIIKGKKAQIGEIREWKGGKYRRTSEGWERIREGKESQTPTNSFSVNDLPQDLSTDNVFKMPLTSKTKKDITDFFIKRFGVKEAYQVPLSQRNKLWDEGEIKNVSVNDIVPSQSFLDRDIVKQKLKNSSNEVPLGISLSFKDGKSDKIILYDGHHRVAADILRGKKTLPIKVISSYEMFKQYKTNNMKNDILKSIAIDMLQATLHGNREEFCLDVLEKGKKAQLGEIRE